MIDMVEIGKRIKKLREDADLTQTKVAEYLSLDQSMVAKMEKGERSISSDVIGKLSALFCCTEAYILFGDDPDRKCAISFRTNALTSADLKSLATINRIVLNQFEMDRIVGGE